MLPAYAKVTGVVATAGSTFQTGDTINGSGATNRVEITDASTVAGNVVATVSNVGEIKHNVVGALNTYDETLYSNVAEEYSSNASVAGNTLTLLNGQLATTYGVKDSAAVASVLNVGIRAADTTGTANTLKLSVRNAGSTIVQTGVAPVLNVATINSTSTGIEAIALVTSGVNNIAITDNPAAGIVTDYAKLTVTGDGANTINVAALTQNLSYDLSGSTGANTLNFGTALQSNTAIIGGTAADTVRVNQNAVVAGISLTGVETLRSSANATAGAAGDTGTIAFTTSSLATLRVDGDSDAVGLESAGLLTLIAPGSIATINYIGDGLAANVNARETFKGVTITGAYNGTADAVTINVSNAGTTNLVGYGFGAITANGVETIAVKAADVGSAAGSLNFANIQSNTLQTVNFVSAAAVNATITASPTVGNSALTLVDLSGVAGTAASTVSFVGVDSVGAATQVRGPANGNLTLNTGLQQAGDTLIVTGGGANTTVNANAAAANNGAAFAGTLSVTAATAGVTNTLNVGDGAGGATTSTTIATFSGAGSTNTITGGNGVDTITISASVVGSVNTVVGNGGADVINGAGSTVALTLQGDAGIDTLTGGSAADRFVFNQAATGNREVVTNFTVAQADVFALSNAAYAGSAAAGTALVVVTAAGAANLATNVIVDTAANIAGVNLGNVRFAYDTTNNNLIFDADGNFGAAQVVIGNITLTGVLTANNFAMIA